MIEKKCPICGRISVMKLSDEEIKCLDKYNKRTELIQEIFPHMTAAEREYIKSGYCMDCMELLFGNSKHTHKWDILVE